MCGLAAVVATDVSTRPADSPGIVAALRRRGPDGEGSWCGADTALWSTRLALWDEGLPSQPYAGPDGLAAAFNGELFNLPHLRDLLGMPGASEIEVLAHGIARLGPAFLREIDGQFAGVVVEGPRRRTTAFRDRMGICPLYTTTAAGGTAYGSEPGALAVLAPGSLDRWSAGGIADLLADWAVPAPATPWTGVGQVEPGSAVVHDAGGTGVRERWADPFALPGANRAPGGPGALGVPAEVAPGASGASGAAGDDAAQAEIEELLRAAVRSRVRSTAEVAVAVSGGVDSTVIAALAREEGLRRSFGIVLPGDELTAARQHEVAAAVGLQHEVVELSPADAWAAFERVVTTRRIPLARLGPVGMAHLAQRVRERGITAVVSGEGADELFGGYDSARVLAARAGAFGPPDRLDWRAFGSAELRADAGPAWHAAYWQTVVTRPSGALDRSRILAGVTDLFGPDLRAAWASRPAGADPSEPPAADGTEADERRLADLRRLLAPFLLTVQGDHAWMGEGVEQRPPYLAGPVVAWALSRPVTGFLTVGAGKQPVRSLLRRLATAYPGLASLDVAKAAYRVDAGLFLREETTWAALCGAIADCPAELLDPDRVLARAEACRRAGRLTDAESTVLLVAASLGLVERLR